MEYFWMIATAICLVGGIVVYLFYWQKKDEAEYFLDKAFYYKTLWQGANRILDAHGHSMLSRNKVLISREDIDNMNSADTMMSYKAKKYENFKKGLLEELLEKYNT